MLEDIPIYLVVFGVGEIIKFLESIFVAGIDADTVITEACRIRCKD